MSPLRRLPRSGVSLALPLAVIAAAPHASAQSPFASRVIAFDDMGRAGGGIFHPPNLLGRPDGGVSSLGIGGWATLGFDVVIADGPGADLIVSENAFYSGPLGSSFAEVVFVEVSSNGSDFARVPSAYHGPPVAPGPFGVVDVGAYEALPGATPVRLGAADPQDVVGAGGDAIDLADLAADPLVVSGRVDLDAIREVRLVDVRSGVDRDSRGIVIYDPGGGSADPDGVTVIHHRANLSARGPAVGLTVPRDGAFEVAVDDPDGLGDLDPASLRIALWGLEVPFGAVLPHMRAIRLSATGFTLKLAGTLPPGMPMRIAVSVRDRAGHRSGACRARPVR